MPSEPDIPQDKLVYANWMRLQGTPYDVALDFGYRTDEAPPAAPAVHLVMTWEHAKDLLTLLGKAVEEYGEQVGGIREFESVIKPAVSRAKQSQLPSPQRRKRK
jgi:hypothetical protein